MPEEERLKSKVTGYNNYLLLNYKQNKILVPLTTAATNCAYEKMCMCKKTLLKEINIVCRTFLNKPQLFFILVLLVFSRR